MRRVVPRRLRTAAGVGFVLAAVLASAAGASNSVTFVDPTGDAVSPAADITTVHVANDDAGTITLRIALPNRAELVDGDLVNVFLDTDGRRDTGCDVGIGVDFGLGVRGHTAPEEDFFSLHALSMSGGQCVFTPVLHPKTFTGTFDTATHEVIFTINRRELRDPSRLQLEVATSFNNQVNVFDFGGATEPWVYDVIAPPPPPDTTPPRVHALASTGVHGRAAHLRYTVSDDSGFTREQVTVTARGRTLFKRHSTLAPSDAQAKYYAPWNVPRSVKGRLRFCVQAWDEAGNRSAPSCAALIVR